MPYVSWNPKVLSSDESPRGKWHKRGRDTEVGEMGKVFGVTLTKSMLGKKI